MNIRVGYSRVSKAASFRFPWVLLGIAVSSGALLSCTVAVGAGVGAAMLGGAALTSGCYDPVDVKSAAAE